MVFHLFVPNSLLKVSSNSGSRINRAISRIMKVKNTSVFGLDKILSITLKGIPLKPKGSTKMKEGTRILLSFSRCSKISSITSANSSFSFITSIFCQFSIFGFSRSKISSRFLKLSSSFSTKKHINLSKYLLSLSATFKAMGATLFEYHHAFFRRCIHLCQQTRQNSKFWDCIYPESGSRPRDTSPAGYALPVYVLYIPTFPVQNPLASPFQEPFFSISSSTFLFASSKSAFAFLRAW
ncbi:MAG: hypothetical protein DDT31_01168 [Syntrophomonadaceae bacterium]|nr:hypothetical protein [Bacillota bacterium]